MLVLSRKVGQELILGDNIRITVTKISGNRVTLGVSAPDNVRIIRGELEPIVRSFEDEKPKRESQVKNTSKSNQASPEMVLRYGGPLAQAVHQMS